MGTFSSEEAKLVQKLASLRQQACPGDYEKYMVLDERDKILCQLREVRTDIVKNSIICISLQINSTLVIRLERCEEMCTEKERYQRIVQKGASPFECDEETGEVSHEMMVKQYARSAADQERPLPHELRSEKVMEHTMCYLLHNVSCLFLSAILVHLFRSSTIFLMAPISELLGITSCGVVLVLSERKSLNCRCQIRWH